MGTSGPLWLCDCTLFQCTCFAVTSFHEVSGKTACCMRIYSNTHSHIWTSRIVCLKPFAIHRSSSSPHFMRRMERHACGMRIYSNILIVTSGPLGRIVYLKPFLIHRSSPSPHFMRRMERRACGMRIYSNTHSHIWASRIVQLYPFATYRWFRPLISWGE